MLKPGAARLASLRVPRVGAAWPAIIAVALAVVLGHSGVQHLEASSALAEHYRTAIGTDEWTRAIGIAQMFAAGGLCFRRTRMVTASVLAAVLVAAIANQFRTGRAELAPSTALLFAWAAAIAIGEARRPGARAGI
jgi:hypothetical protein